MLMRFDPFREMETMNQFLGRQSGRAPQSRFRWTPTDKVTVSLSTSTYRAWIPTQWT
jgi:hypothetical protein